MEGILQSLRHTFASVTGQAPTPAPGVQHSIYLTDPAPIKQAAYRQSPMKQQVIRDNVRKLLQNNLIQPSNSPWSSPVVLVMKHSGEWRMCIDYRKLNARTRKDAYPIPLIEDCLNMCKDADFLTLIDIKDAYHHVEMDPASRPLTAFVTPDGLYEWLRMPFGLCNAPATFQRYVNNALQGLAGRSCAAFFDDCIVFTKGTLQQHMEQVTQVLERLAQHGLEASYKKCKFAYRELIFVGHLVRKGTIRPDPAKLEAVSKFPEPKNLSQLKSFMGLANYYHKFIRGFALISRPLYALTRKDVPFNWTPQCVAAFETLKRALLSAPCLYAPNLRLPFILQTDASGEGIAAVLTQEVDGEEHPIAYISRQLSKAEQNYSPTEWECLAVVWAVGQFQHYLIDAPFTIVTDHAALKWLPTKKFENTRIMRWSMKLAEYTYTVQHRPGKGNANADALSRCPVPESAPESTEELDSPVRRIHYTILEVNQASLTPELPFGEWTPPPSLLAYLAQKTIKKDSKEGGEESKQATMDPALPKHLQPFALVDLTDVRRVVQAQREDPVLLNIINYKERREMPANFSEVQKKRLHFESENYALLPVERVGPSALHYCPARPRRGMSSLVPYTPRLVIPPPHRVAIIRAFHDHPLGGHFGIKRTSRKVAARYYWKTLTEDVAAYVKACGPCQTVKANRLKDKAPTGQILPPTEPFELVALDFVGPLPRHEDFSFILTMIDHFSGWCIAVPVIEQTAEIVVQCLLERLICQFGVPRRILTDRGKQFEGTLMKSFCRLLRIQQLTTTSYNPQSNGKVERINGTLKGLLETLISSPDTTAPWPQLLQSAVFSYNTSTSEATGMSPYFTLFGREAVTPGDQAAVSMEQGEDTSIPTDALALLLHRNISEAHAFIRALLDSKREVWAKEQAQLERSRTYAVGDLVYLINETGAVERPGYSLKPAAYVGPYRVVRRLNDVSYHVQWCGTRKGARTRTTLVPTHVRRMRPAAPAEAEIEPTDVNGGAGAPPPTATAVPPTLPREKTRSEMGAVDSQEAQEMNDAATDSGDRTSSPPEDAPIAERVHHRAAQQPRPVYNESLLAPSTASHAADRRLSLPRRQ